MLDLATLEVASSKGLPRCISARMKRDSDQPAIAEAAKERLQRSAYHGVHQVQCDYQHGTLILSGRVASFHHKQMAQEAVRDLSGVKDILNRVEVIQPVQNGECLEVFQKQCLLGQLAP